MSEDESEMMTNGSVRFNNNSYISIGIVVLLIGATIWIKDGQTRSATAVEKASSELIHYKEIQAKDGEILKAKFDALSKLVEAATQDRYTARDARSVWRQFQALNPTLRIPEFSTTP